MDAQRAELLLSRWAAWVDELEDHPLDSHEYEGALECRDALATELELVGSERLWARADEVDARFADLIRQDESGRSGRGWWRARVQTNASDPR